MIQKIEKQVWIKPKISINRVKKDNEKKALDFIDRLNEIEYEWFLRREIQGYPKEISNVLSKKWYWKDEFIKIEKDLVLVTWAASSSGKMSTCLWQIYLEQLSWIDSWYAKYETFPIWNLELNHPVNLAYEAATADIWDYNELDKYHIDAYSMKAVNYNRDVEAFEIVKTLSKKFLPEDNHTRQYKSPTDMWISTAWFCITDNEIVSKASIEEIDRRISWYKEVVERWDWKQEWVEKCEDLKRRVLDILGK